MQTNLFHNDESENERFVPLTVDQNRYRLFDWARGLILQQEETNGDWYQVEVLPIHRLDQRWIFYNQSVLLVLQIPKPILLQSESAGALRLAWLQLVAQVPQIIEYKLHDSVLLSMICYEWSLGHLNVSDVSSGLMKKRHHWMGLWVEKSLEKKALKLVRKMHLPIFTVDSINQIQIMILMLNFCPKLSQLRVISSDHLQILTRYSSEPLLFNEIVRLILQYPFCDEDLFVIAGYTQLVLENKNCLLYITSENNINELRSLVDSISMWMTDDLFEKWLKARTIQDFEDLYIDQVLIPLKKKEIEELQTAKPFQDSPFPVNDVVEYISSPLQLYNEGRRMKHCCNSLRDDIESGECLLYHIHVENGATVEIRYKSNGYVWAVTEVQGPGNSPPSPSVLQAIKNWIESEKLQQPSDGAVLIYSNILFE